MRAATAASTSAPVAGFAMCVWYPAASARVRSSRRGVRGEGGRGRPASLLRRAGADLADQRVAVDAGHLQVAQQDVGAKAPERLERLGRRADRLDHGAGAEEDRGHEIAPVALVVHDQHADAGDGRQVLGRSRLRGRARPLAWSPAPASA